MVATRRSAELIDQYRNANVREVLTSNAKLAKGDEYEVRGLAFPPHTLSGDNLCRVATHCVASCIGYYSGRQVTESVREAHQKCYRWFADSPDSFHAALDFELTKYRQQFGDDLLVRLNVFSDLDWRATVAKHPQQRFYDYTKWLSRWSDKQWPSNYHLTYSWNERSHRREGIVSRGLRSGRNVSVVFDVDWYPQNNNIGTLPDYFRVGYDYWPVLDGDAHDFRVPDKDGFGKVIGLRLKGTNEAKQAARDSGFAINPTTDKRCRV